jgi:peptidylprolyl isomerase
VTTVKDGDRVRVHYTGRRADGTVFDSSRGGEPIAFTAGSAELIAGVSFAVIGMAPGESRTVRIQPEQGYGLRRPGMDRRVPREVVPEEAEVGDALDLVMGDGMATLWVCELGDDYALLDANPPLAGEVLEFDLEVIAIEAGEPQL